MRNADLAKAVYAEMEASTKERPLGDPCRKFPFLPWPSSYYLVRQTALSYRALYLRPALLSTLEHAQWMHMDICTFTVVYMSTKEHLRHGILKADEDRVVDDVLNDFFAQPDWKQAHDVVFEISPICRVCLRHRGSEPFLTAKEHWYKSCVRPFR